MDPEFAISRIASLPWRDIMHVSHGEHRSPFFLTRQCLSQTIAVPDDLIRILGSSHMTHTPYAEGGAAAATAMRPARLSWRPCQQETYHHLLPTSSLPCFPEARLPSIKTVGGGRPYLSSPPALADSNPPIDRRRSRCCLVDVPWGPFAGIHPPRHSHLHTQCIHPKKCWLRFLCCLVRLFSPTSPSATLQSALGRSPSPPPDKSRCSCQGH